MFLLNIISGNSNTGPTDAFNSLFATESKVESLESLLKSIFMNGTNGSDIDIEAVKQQLSQARQEEVNFLNTIGDSLDHDPSGRYGEIRNDESFVDQTIKELQTKLELLNAAQITDDNQASDLNNDKEVAQLTEELNRLVAYKSELNEADQFWGSLKTAHQLFEISMQKKDEFFNGTKVNGQSSDGFNKLLELEGLLKFLEAGGDGSKYDTDLTTDGIQLAQGITNLNDRNEIREKILKIETGLLEKIPAVKNESWFKTFLDNSGEYISKINEDTQSLEKKLNDLNQAFISMMAGDLSEATINGATYKSVQEIKEQILRTTGFINDLNGENNLMSQINNVASADSNSESKTLDDAKKSISNDLQKSLQIEQISSAMYIRMELQALETILTVRGEPTYQVSGVENDLDAVTEALNSAKTNETKLRGQFGITPESSVEVNLTFAKKMNEVVDGRITDLKDAEQFILDANQIFYTMLKTAGYQGPDSFYYEDPNLITTRAEIQKVEEYKKGMNELESYWNKVMDDNKLTNTLQFTNNTSPSIKAIVKGTEKKVIDLRAIFDFMSDRDSIETLESQESSIRHEIETEIRRLSSLISNSPTYVTDRKHTLDKVADLKASLSSVIQQKSYSQLMSQIEGSVKEALSKESIFHGIYSR